MSVDPDGTAGNRFIDVNLLCEASCEAADSIFFIRAVISTVGKFQDRELASHPPPIISGPYLKTVYTGHMTFYNTSTVD